MNKFWSTKMGHKGSIQRKSKEKSYQDLSLFPNLKVNLGKAQT